MSKLRVHNFTISLDGFGAGPNQNRDNPLGEGGEQLHEWAFNAAESHPDSGGEGGEEGLDNEYVKRGIEGIGATIMGRNMFGPIRGAWDDDGWTGWWGVDPPYHHPVFVLTHHARPTITMEGGTTFHFVTDGIEVALERATEAADGQDVALAGGVSTIQQYLRAGLVDEMHVVIAPILLGSGERLFESSEGGAFGYECVELVTSESVVHASFRRSSE